jgi:hypothetical protein
MKKMSLTSKKAGITFLIIALTFGSIITITQIQKQQELRTRASTANWATSQSATAVCSSGTVLINVNFKNEEPTKSMLVKVNDNQSSQTTNLGIVGPSATISGVIDTKLPSIDEGTVIFNLAWADNPNEKDTSESSYAAIAACQPAPICTDTSESACTWDTLPYAKEYNVTVKETTSGKTVKSGTVTAPATKFIFPNKLGETYQCSVDATNACGTGNATKSQPASCKIPPTPTPTTIPICKEDESTCTWNGLTEATEYDVKIIDAGTEDVIKSGTVSAPTTKFNFAFKPGITYKCEVTPVSKCGTGKSTQSPPTICEVSPTPTSMPLPSPTPTETPTPLPTPTDTPVPTPTNTPTPTLITSIPTPINTPMPTPTPYPTYTPFPTPTTIIIVRSQPTPPPQIIYQQLPPGTPQPTRIIPTLAPTGATQSTTLIAGISIFLITLGSLAFFIL